MQLEQQLIARLRTATLRFSDAQTERMWAIVSARMNALTLRHAHTVPAILANAGENAATKLGSWEQRNLEQR